MYLESEGTFDGGIILLRKFALVINLGIPYLTSIEDSVYIYSSDVGFGIWT